MTRFDSLMILRDRWSRWRKADESILLLSALCQRCFGFFATFILSRSLGSEAVGLYTSINITVSAVTSPFSGPLGNTANVVAAEYKEGRTTFDILRLQLPIFLATSCLTAVISGFAVYYSLYQSTNLLQWSNWWLVVLPLLISFGIIGSQFIGGVFHGVARPRVAAKLAILCTAVGLFLCGPVVVYYGITGMLILAVCTALLPVLSLTLLSRKHGMSKGVRIEVSSYMILQKLGKALPSMLSALLKNLVNWFCCIYLTLHYYGPSGAGVITIALQWVMLMQLPLLAWEGRMIASMMSAKQMSHEEFEVSKRLWQKKTMFSAAIVGLLVVAASPLIVAMYKLTDSSLQWLLVVYALASCLYAVVYVQERAYFCQMRQKHWFRTSCAADIVQVSLTILFVAESIMIVPLASLAATCFTLGILRFSKQLQS